MFNNRLTQLSQCKHESTRVCARVIHATSLPDPCLRAHPASCRYMVVLHTARGAVSNGHIVSVYQRK